MSGAGDLNERAAQALECKNKGNEFLKQKKFNEAIQWYTEGIKYEPENHILYSNRSAAYLSLGNTEFALRDANECIRIKPDFPKGYARKGAAYHAMKKYDQAIDAYDEGLKLFPDNSSLVSGKADAERARENSRMPRPEENSMPQPSPEQMINELFGPNFINYIRSDPEFSSYLDDPDFMEKYRAIQTDPENGFINALQDKRFSKVLEKMIGLRFAPPDQFNAEQQNEVPRKEDFMPEKKEEEKKEEEKPAEPELTEEQKQVKSLKEEGNALYKKKKFEEALECYNKALEIDSDNMPIMNNIAAVYFEQGKYDECIEQCNKTIEYSKEHAHSYEDVAKSYCRLGNAYYKKNDWEKALENYENSQMEFPLPNIKSKIRQAEQLKKECIKKALYNPEEALKHKEKGNELFQEGKYVESIREYDEAIKHDNNNPVFYLNKSSALSKLMDMGQALDYIEKAIKLDPKYVKAYWKKGQILLFLKKYYKAEQAFKKGLEIDPNDRGCLDGLQTTTIKINEIMTGPEDPEQRKRALEDPEIQAVITDPTIQKVLKDMNTDPSSISKYMRNPGIAEKIRMLIASGIIKVG